MYTRETGSSHLRSRKTSSNESLFRDTPETKGQRAAVWGWIDLTGVDYDSTARPGTRGPPTRSVQPESDSRSAAGASDDPRW